MKSEPLKIEHGIGWKKKSGGLVSADIADYVAEIERLRAALRRYGLHTWDCAWNDTLGERSCDCGWDKQQIALAQQEDSHV